MDFSYSISLFLEVLVWIYIFIWLFKKHNRALHRFSVIQMWGAFILFIFFLIFHPFNKNQQLLEQYILTAIITPAAFIIGIYKTLDIGVKKKDQVKFKENKVNILFSFLLLLRVVFYLYFCVSFPWKLLFKDTYFLSFLVMNLVQLSILFGAVWGVKLLQDYKTKLLDNKVYYFLSGFVLLHLISFPFEKVTFFQVHMTIHPIMNMLSIGGNSVGIIFALYYFYLHINKNKKNEKDSKKDKKGLSDLLLMKEV